MAAWHRLALLVLLLTEVRDCLGDAKWKDPWMTSAPDKYIQKYDKASYRIFLYEDVPHDHTIAVLQINATPGEKVSIRQDSSDDIQLKIDPSTYNVTVKSNLDFENNKKSTLTATIMLNSGNNRNLLIQIVNVNDNPPMFNTPTSQINLEVPENKRNDSLLALTATDADNLGNISFDITTDDDSFFKLDTPGSDKCLLQLTKTLDYETKQLYRLTISATDVADERDQSNRLTTNLTVFINVVDIGDSPPRWLKPPPTISEKEGEKNGTVLFNVSATDGDTMVNNKIEYKLLNQTPPNWVKLDKSTGGVILLKDLDREDPDFKSGAFISIEVQAKEQDGGSSCTNISCISTMGLITVVDIDDNPPLFENDTYLVTVPENKRNGLGLNVQVTDADTMNPNGAFRLTLDSDAPKGVFEIITTRGSSSLVTDIQVINSSYLDFEDPSHQSINFTLVATGENSNHFSSTAMVTVMLEDLNDETPKFVQGSFAVNITEDFDDGQKIISVKATDADISPEFGNESIRYSLSGGGVLAKAIDVDNATGEIKISGSIPFDFDQGVKTVTYTLTATDSYGDSAKGQSDTAELTIQVQDIDDTPPTLDLPSGCSVEEERKNTVVTANIEGTDVDSIAELEYSIDWKQTTALKDGVDVDKSAYDFTKTFQIDRLKAKLSTTETPPDREQMDTIHLMIVVNDTKTETGKSFAQKSLAVTIKDINDNKPKFTNLDETTQINVTENFPEQYVLFTVLAIDEDENNTISYSASGESKFTSLVGIDKTNGALQVKGKIDRETYSRINVTITAEDSGVPPLNESVDISIEVLDVNDCLPKWVEEPSSISNLNVTEGKPTGVFYTLRAEDDDKPGTSYSNITYQLGAGSEKNFTVDPVTGEVTVKGSLDRELLKDSNYAVTVKVQAGDECDEDGNCHGYINDFMSVHVLDVNDCTPVFPDFQSTSMVAKVNEKLSAGGPVSNGPVGATDDDEIGTLATNLTYELINVINTTEMGCNDLELFTVTTILRNQEFNSANIKSNKSLDGCWGVYNVTISATDGEKPFNKGQGVYQITVTDVNDPPKIVSPLDGFSFNIAENRFNSTWPGRREVKLENGTTVVIKAVDPDNPSTDNSKIRYSILSSSSPPGANIKFEVDPDNGTLYQQKPVDREDSSGFSYKLDIEARDMADKPLTNTIQLNLNVTDVDEYLPEFDERVDNSVEFYENRTAGNETMRIKYTAKDKDETDNIFYFLVGGAKDTFELVDPTATRPELRTKKVLDHENKTSYTLILETTSNNSYPGDVDLFDYTNLQLLKLNVSVIDINDMTPSFNGRHFWGGIAQGDQKDAPIMVLEALDPDLNDPTEYRITSEVKPSDESITLNISDPFILELNSGRLKLNFDVSEGMKGYFDFQVTAMDQAKHSSKTPVRVFIITQEDRVNLVFSNPVAFIQAQQQKVEDKLSSAFSLSGKSLLATVERIVSGTQDKSASDVTVHFIDADKVEPVPAATIINLQFNEKISQQLIEGLGAIGLNLTKIGDNTVSPEAKEDTLFQMLLIVVASVLGGILCLTLITACIQTTKLRRQVKALSINAFGSKESGLQHAGLAVPGSNVYANQGANPIFSMDEKRAPDSESVSSGDSVLIGVEDNPEFKGFSPSRAGQRGPAPPPPSPLEHIYSTAEPSAGGDLVRPAVFDENSRHHMPHFERDEEGDAGHPDSPFSAAGGRQNPLFDAEEGGFGDGGGTTQNPLFGGGEGTTQNPLFGGGEGTTSNPLFGADDGNFGTASSEF